LNGENEIQKIAVYTGNEKDFIEGTALEVTSDELVISDGYEPDPYTRKKIILESERPAWIYTK
jgi:hypothetical protein